MPGDNEILRMSEEVIRQNTGKTLNEWCAILDKFSAPTKGRLRVVKHLMEFYPLNEWWSQVVLIRYEYARGLRK